jgi:hypothetical protein
MLTGTLILINGKHFVSTENGTYPVHPNTLQGHISPNSNEYAHKVKGDYSHEGFKITSVINRDFCIEEINIDSVGNSTTKRNYK